MNRSLTPVDLFDRLAAIRMRQRQAADQVLELQEEIRRLDAEWDELEIQAVGLLEVEISKPRGERCILGRCYEAGIQREFAILLANGGELVAREVLSAHEMTLIQPAAAHETHKPYLAAHAAVAG